MNRAQVNALQIVQSARVLAFPIAAISLEQRLAHATHRQDVLDLFGLSYLEYEVLCLCRFGRLSLVAENYQAVHKLKSLSVLRHHIDRSGRRRGWRLTSGGESLLKACQMELGENCGNPKPASGNKLLRWPSMRHRMPSGFAS